MALEQTLCYLLLGSNLGDRKSIIMQAVGLLEDQLGKLIAKSALYETAAWGKTDQPVFLNQAIAIETSLSALKVLEIALKIEKDLGRIRKEKWGERTIDIDVILFGDKIIDEGEKLQVPHPHMHNRKFVMAPMAEIAPNLIHPIFNDTILNIFENINDPLTVKKL
jgi:2-amino-4-hydroxy-6-hydroxymethyldihydropteridine diphosphokinase